MLTPERNAILLIIPAVLLIIAAVLSRLPALLLGRRLVLLEPFVLGTAVLSLFQAGGFMLFLFIIAKCTLCLFTMLLLSGTTPFHEIVQVLEKIHVPAILITTISLMYRYLFVLGDEAQRMRRARLSRTFDHGRLNLWRALAGVVGHLFVRTTERAERIYGAMCARGWR